LATKFIRRHIVELNVQNATYGPVPTAVR